MIDRRLCNSRLPERSTATFLGTFAALLVSTLAAGQVYAKKHANHCKPFICTADRWHCSMEIYALPGHQVVVTEKTAQAGEKSDQKEVSTLLTIGKPYTVKKTVVSNSHTSVELKEIPHKLFNSVNFMDVCVQPAADTFRHPGWASIRKQAQFYMDAVTLRRVNLAAADYALANCPSLRVNQNIVNRLLRASGESAEQVRAEKSYIDLLRRWGKDSSMCYTLARSEAGYLGILRER